MSTLKELRKAVSIKDLAGIIGCQPKSISYVLYKKPISKSYKSFKIFKKNGGMRSIESPCRELKFLQSKLSVILQDCIDEINLERNSVNKFSHGFRREHSIMTNAYVHRNRRYVFNLDLEDFFGSINFGRVRGFLIKNKNFTLNKQVSTVIAQLVCYKNVLPQGGPTSPVISNLIGHLLDIKLASLAYEAGCSYSRYADDITFSTNKNEFPNAIAIPELSDIHSWSCSKGLEKIIIRQGFKVNKSKTHMQYARSSQQVTGLTVNKKVNVSSVYWRYTRAMTSHLFKHGVCYIKSSSSLLSVAQLEGRLNYLYQVEQFNSDKMNNKTIKMSSKLQLYSEFVYYKNFYNPTLVSILTEGKTDKIYIDCALKRLANQFSKLVNVAISSEHEKKYQIFNYTKKSAQLCSMSGGSEQLKKFIKNYRSKCVKFSRPNVQNPVIVVIDNDQGSNSIYALLENYFKIDLKGRTEKYYYVCLNLYVVPIPKLNAEKVCIEDLFDNAVLGTRISGKTFSKKDDFSDMTHYGKNIFAQEVVKKNISTIDFSKFVPLLSSIEAAIAHWEARVV